MISASRLLGFAFSASDLLLEINKQGIVVFALGAASATNSYNEAALIGNPAALIFAPQARSQFDTMLHRVSTTKRMGPQLLSLANGTSANVSLCHLPANGDLISCTLKVAETPSADSEKADASTGLSNSSNFLDDIAGDIDSLEELALIEIPALTKACDALDPAAAHNLMQQIGAALKAGSRAAMRISETKFGYVATDNLSIEKLTGHLAKAIANSGVKNLQVDVSRVQMGGGALNEEQRMLALRHVVDRFASGELDSRGLVSLADAFDTMVGETMARAKALTSTVSSGEFSLAFDAIVDLKSRAVVHHEVLSRFAAGQSPSDTIRFAERMDMASAVDLAVASKVFDELEQPGGKSLSLALNVSGKTIATPEAFAVLRALFAHKANVAKRVLIELTESEAIPDIEATNRVVQELRKMGYRVGIDDFGAGAASLQYLHGFEIDFVKFDGSLIQRIGRSARDDALLRGMIGLCRILEVKTVAEWIDTEDKAKRACDMGFDLGQGKLFGIGLARPKIETPTPIRARRQGAREEWG